MSWSDTRRARAFLAVSLLVGSAALLQGCQVRPLYASGPNSPEPKLASISVGEVGTRVAQQVRNHLIFLLDRGGAEPVNPAYSLTLSVSEAAIGFFIDAAGDAPTAGKMKVTAAYVLKDAKTGKVLKAGSRIAVAGYDLPPQEFTKIRAIRDAENRAAIAAAELVDADLAGFLAR